MAVIAAKNITKTYQTGDDGVVALDTVSLAINDREFIAIMGTSGSGKSTLMHLLGCLDTPDSGELFIDGKNTAQMTADELAQVRNKKIGFVFQRFHLLPDLTATENVALPLLYAGMTETAAEEKALTLLEGVGLADRSTHYPYQLSGGQQQRVAIARALANNPDIILADEPTGNLDTKTGNAILALLKKLNIENGVTVVLITHEPDVARHANRVVEIIDGKIVKDTRGD